MSAGGGSGERRCVSVTPQNAPRNLVMERSEKHQIQKTLFIPVGQLREVKALKYRKKTLKRLKFQKFHATKAVMETQPLSICYLRT